MYELPSMEEKPESFKVDLDYAKEKFDKSAFRKLRAA